MQSHIAWITAALCALGLALGAGKVVSAQSPADEIGPPPGVAASAWIEISPRFGFVVQGQGRDRPHSSLDGYFLIRRQGRWWHIAAPRGGVSPVGSFLSSPQSSPIRRTG